MGWGAVAKAAIAAVAPLAVGLAVLATPGVARADGSVSPKGKGIVGGALLGAEVVMMPMGIAGLKPWWPYLVFGGVGAAGGAVGGWAIESQINAPDGPPAEATVYMLAGGLALVIPTLVVTLNATTKKDFGEEPSATPTTDDKKPGTPAQPGDQTTVNVQTSRAHHLHLRRAPEHPRVSLVDVSEGDLQLGVPAVEVRPMYTPVEIAQFGVEQQTEVHIPVFSSTF
jgi:hypothetical protein